MGAGGRGEVNEELVFNGDSSSSARCRVLEMDGGEGCTAVGMYILPLNCTLENA